MKKDDSLTTENFEDKNRLNNKLHSINIKIVWKWILLGTIIGIVAGVGALVFFHLLNWVSDLSLHKILHIYPPEAAGERVLYRPEGVSTIKWLFFVVPTIGGLIAGFIIFTFAPEAEGHGTDSVIDAFHRHRGLIRSRVPFVKIIASAITIGTGGSAGREGPIAQIGSGFASFLSKVLKLTARDRRILILAGASAGIGAIFRAPLGGALFAVEVLYSEAEFEFEAMMVCIISSIVAYSLFAAINGWGTLFQIPSNFSFHNPLELPVYALMGIICAFVGIIYVNVFYGMRDRVFRRIPIPNFLKPAIGGLLLGILAFFLPEIIAGGYGYIQKIISSPELPFPIHYLLILVFAKILATSFTLSSGGSGGVFAPSLFIGAMLGGAFGHLMHYLFPHIVEQPGAFALVGMAGFFAGVAKVPIASLIMVSEMSEGYALLVPLMLVCAITFLLTGKFSLYEKQIDLRVHSPAHLGDFIIDVLEGLTVREACNDKFKTPTTIKSNVHLKDIVNLLTETSASHFPVVNNKNEMTGIISVDDIRKVLHDVDLNDLIIANDIATSPVIIVTPNEDLHSALRKFTYKNIEELPVVQPDNHKRVIGMFSRRDLINAYNVAMKKRHLLVEEDEGEEIDTNEN